MFLDKIFAVYDILAPVYGVHLILHFADLSFENCISKLLIFDTKTIIYTFFLTKLQTFQNGLSSGLSSKSVRIDEAVLAVDPIGPAHILPYPSCTRDHVPGDFYYGGYVGVHRQIVQ